MRGNRARAGVRPPMGRNKIRVIVLVKKYVFWSIVVSASANCFAGAGATILLPNTVVPNACVYENIGVYESGVVMIPVYEDSVFTCERGYWLPKQSETCAGCPENSYCPGGEYTYSETDDGGLFACPDGTFAPSGMWEAAQCGRILHIGDDILYLRSIRKTMPSLHFDFNADGVADFFANTTTRDVPMNKNSERKFRFRMGENIYSVYDDTVDVTIYNDIVVTETVADDTDNAVADDVSDDDVNNMSGDGN